MKWFMKPLVTDVKTANAAKANTQKPQLNLGFLFLMAASMYHGLMV
ncbi:hypothetical protein LX59_03115 [Azomonas agilis]|uniref:Uncharacterized protein n=1 Tax=Azomonas agilis TaxID=116849 RepID=A0A562HZ79_9GAMM|nr:hypothetical protein LX59_03115 [Azomonas agilis]